MCFEIPPSSPAIGQKGFWGECGRRGGYMELVNVDEEVRCGWLGAVICFHVCFKLALACTRFVSHTFTERIHTHSPPLTTR